MLERIVELVNQFLVVHYKTFPLFMRHFIIFYFFVDDIIRLVYGTLIVPSSINSELCAEAKIKLKRMVIHQFILSWFTIQYFPKFQKAKLMKPVGHQPESLS